MGTPEFAVPALGALIEAGHNIVCVYSQPPRPAGRGQKERPSPVQALASARGIPVRTPKSLRDPAEQTAFADLRADAAIVVAYGLILPKPVLDAPRLGCLNLHASKLPRWRGAAPIQRAVMAGDTETAVAVMQMEVGLDTGPVLAERPAPIGPQTTAGALHDQLSDAGARLMCETLARLAAGEVRPRPQADEGVTYANKIDKAECHIDWSQDADVIDRRIRGLSPQPGAWFDWRGERIKILLAEPLDRAGPAAAPGTVLDADLTIACGNGRIRPLTLQRAGRGPLSRDAFLRGFPLQVGERLG